MRPLHAIAFLAVAIVTFAQDQPAGAWLDSTPVQWNTPGANFPKAPQDVPKNITPEYCKAHQRPVRLQEEHVVAGAGWMVFASSKGKNGLTVVGGALSYDGMCRPDPYQYFVFVRGKFAGTLSPGLMRARSDGSVNKVSFAGRRKIVAAFSRYTAADPLCCPSKLSEATYEIRQESGKPVVIVVGVRTRPT
jgi:LppP/LprE lipoprotein